ncbi:hypothetical protein [Kitasatospora sp. NPDC097643]|uniref:hypothetical protein n=1 Tax=Kitasatospora sp. NPDC097643 TaxID=3157230 RepID=UPI0033253A78
MAFDEQRYRREVLDAGLPVRDNLRWRYQLPERLTAEEVATTVAAVRACWARLYSRLKYKPVITELRAADVALRPVLDAAAGGDLGPLRAELASQDSAENTARARLRAALEQAADGLGLLAPAALAELARAHDSTPDALRALLDGSGITLAEPETLPVEPPHPAYAPVARQLEILKLRHLADFLETATTGGRCAGPVRYFAPPRTDTAVVDRAAHAWGRQPHGAVLTAAETVVAAARQVLREQGPDGLAAALRYELLTALRRRRTSRSTGPELLGHAVDGLGLDRGDARRLVFAVLHEHPDREDPVLAELRRLAAAGRLTAAVETARRAPAGTLPPEAEQLRDHLGAELDRALAKRRQAERIRGTDPDRAWYLLDEIEAAVKDLPGVDDLRRALPPHPVPSVTAHPDGAGVLVGWRPTPSTAGEPVYRIVRTVGRPPRTERDGTELPPPAPGADSLRDPDPPVNALLHYGVSVRRAAEPNGQPSRLAVSPPVFHRPEVSGAGLRAGSGVVTARWSCPPEAESVQVTRDPGGVPVPAGRDGFTDTGLSNATAYGYRIRAVYRGPDGARAATAGLRLTAVPSAPPSPVGALTVRAQPGQPGRLVAHFARPRSGTVELYLLDREPPWPAGHRLPVARVRAAARSVDARPERDGGLGFTAPGGRAVVLAVTVAGEDAVIGDHQPVLALPGLGRLTATRRSGEVLLALDWPAHEVDTIELGWSPAGEPPRTQVVTRGDYLHHGGVRLPAPDGRALRIEARAVATVDRRRVLGPPSTVELPARIDVDYTVTRTGLPGRRRITAVLTAPPDAPAGLRADRIVLVLGTGPGWPLRPEEGTALGELRDVELPPGTPVELSVAAPAHRGGYWLRCFATGGGVVLRDPAARTLKVK